MVPKVTTLIRSQTQNYRIFVFVMTPNTLTILKYNNMFAFLSPNKQNRKCQELSKSFFLHESDFN